MLCQDFVGAKLLKDVISWRPLTTLAAQADHLSALFPVAEHGRDNVHHHCHPKGSILSLSLVSEGKCKSSLTHSAVQLVLTGRLTPSVCLLFRRLTAVMTHAVAQPVLWSLPLSSKFQWGQKITRRHIIAKKKKKKWTQQGQHFICGFKHFVMKLLSFTFFQIKWDSL